MAKALAVQAALNCPSRPLTTNSYRLAQSRLAGTSGRRSVNVSRAYKVEIETQRGVETITVEDGDTILQTALDQGIELTHDCKMGVCMTCPARLVIPCMERCLVRKLSVQKQKLCWHKHQGCVHPLFIIMEMK